MYVANISLCSALILICNDQKIIYVIIQYNTLHEKSEDSSFVTRIILPSVSDILLLAATIDIFCEPVSVWPNNYYSSYLSKLLIANDYYISSWYVLRVNVKLLFYYFSLLNIYGGLTCEATAKWQSTLL